MKRTIARITGISPGDWQSTIAPLGYTHFAAEAFDPDTFANDAFRYARTNFGTYVNEPVFGSLVRTAKDLGLELVAHDANESATPTRSSNWLNE